LVEGGTTSYPFRQVLTRHCTRQRPDEKTDPIDASIDPTESVDLDNHLKGTETEDPAVQAASRKRTLQDDHDWCQRWGAHLSQLHRVASHITTAVPDVIMGDDRRVKRRAQATALEAKREACEKSMASFSEACKADDAPHYFGKLGDALSALASLQSENMIGLKQEITEVKDDIGSLRADSDKQDTKLDRLEEDIASIKAGTSASTAAPSAGGASSVGGAGVQRQWNPSYIELRGWVTDASSAMSRSETQITDLDCQRLIRNLLDLLGEEGRAKVDDVGTLRVNGNQPMFSFCRIKFCAGTDGDVLWNCKHSLDAIILDPVNAQMLKHKLAGDRTMQNILTDMDRHPNKIIINIKAPEWKKCHIAAVGRFHGVWRQTILK